MLLLLENFTMGQVCRASAVVLLAALVSSVHAQLPEDIKAAADKWMSRPSFKMAFAGATTGWRSTFEFNRASGMTAFWGATEYCFANEVPTKVTFNGQQLVVAFDFRTGCAGVQYRFNPITGVGEVFFAPPGSDQWTVTQSTISLRE